MSTATVMEPSTQLLEGNLLWHLLPESVLSSVVARLRTEDVAAASATCKQWRVDVHSTVAFLAPKSVQALQNVRQFNGLKHLQLQQLRDWPTVDASSSRVSPLSHAAALTSLTRLDLNGASSATRGRRPVAVTQADMQRVLPGLTALRELDLTGQTVLLQPNSLRGLAKLRHLTKLSAAVPDSKWPVSRSNWQQVAAITQLQSLDLTRWWSSSGGPAQAAEGAAQASAVPAAAAAAAAAALRRSAGEAGAGGGASPRLMGHPTSPLVLLSGMERLQQLKLGSADLQPDAEGLAVVVRLPGLTSLDLSEGHELLLEQLAVQYLAAQSATEHVEKVCSPARHHLSAPGFNSSSWSSSSSNNMPPCLPRIRVHPYLSVSASNSGRMECGLSMPQQMFHPLLPMPDSPAAAAAAAIFNNSEAHGSMAAAAALDDSAFEHEQAVKRRRRQHQRVMQLSALRLNGIRQLAISGQQLAPFTGLVTLELKGGHSFGALMGVVLPLLEHISLRGVQHVDYLSLCRLLHTSRQLQLLDLAYSTLELHGPTSSSYHYPAAAGGNDLLAQVCAGTYGGHLNSRRRQLTGAAAADGSAAAAGPQRALLTVDMEGVREVWLPEVVQLVAGAEQQLGQRLERPSLVVDLLQHLGLQLKALYAGGCSPAVTQKLLRLIEGQQQLTVLSLPLSGAPPDNSTWSRPHLKQLTALEELDLSYMQAPRTAYVHTGTCPTQQVLQMAAALPRLHTLKLAGWSFYFAKLHPLAPLAPRLRQLDLCNGRGLSDGTLWSMTHLTGLTSLALSGAAPSSDRIFDLLFEHLPHLQQLSLASCRTFTNRSMPALLKLPHLTALDLSEVTGLTGTAVQILAQLSKLRALWLGGVGEPGGWQEQDLVPLGDLQSLRRLAVGPGAAVEQKVRELLPAWVEVG